MLRLKIGLVRTLVSLDPFSIMTSCNSWDDFIAILEGRQPKKLEVVLVTCELPDFFQGRARTTIIRDKRPIIRLIPKIVLRLIFTK